MLWQKVKDLRSVKLVKDQARRYKSSKETRAQGQDLFDYIETLQDGFVLLKPSDLAQWSRQERIKKVECIMKEPELEWTQEVAYNLLKQESEDYRANHQYREQVSVVRPWFKDGKPRDFNPLEPRLASFT